MSLYHNKQEYQEMFLTKGIVFYQNMAHVREHSLISAKLITVSHEELPRIFQDTASYEPSFEIVNQKHHLESDGMPLSRTGHSKTPHML